MGYEIAGGLGVKMAAPEREVYVLVGDGSYLMMARRSSTAVQEGIKLTIVLLDNHGFASIGGLSESVGSGGFGTRYRYRNAATGDLDGEVLPVDLAANAASLGARACIARDTMRASARCARARPGRAAARPVIVVPVDREARVGGYESWWDVPVAEVSTNAHVQQARARCTTRLGAASATFCDPRRQRALFLGRARIRDAGAARRRPRKCWTKWRPPATPARSSATGDSCRLIQGRLSARSRARSLRWSARSSRSGSPTAAATRRGHRERGARQRRCCGAAGRRMRSSSCRTTTPRFPTYGTGRTHPAGRRAAGGRVGWLRRRARGWRARSASDGAADRVSSSLCGLRRDAGGDRCADVADEIRG